MMATMLPRVDMRLRKLTRTKKKNNNDKKRKSDKMDYLRAHVSSYQEFKSLVEQCVIKGGVPAISFNISDDVDEQSYRSMLCDVLAYNSKLGRLDKIENPREDQRPLLVVRCYTVKEMDNVYKAIGPYWRAIMAERSRYNISKNDKLANKMYSFRARKGILDHYHDPDWA